MGSRIDPKVPSTTTQTNKPAPYERKGEITRQLNRNYTYSKGQFADDFFTKAGHPSKTEQRIGDLLGKAGTRTLKEGSFDVHKTAYGKSGSYSGAGGKVNAQYSVKVGDVGVRGSGQIGLKNGALIAQGQVEANATLLDAQASAHAKWGALEAQGNAYVFAGARAKANGTLTIDPKRGIYAAEVGGEAFAGVKAGVSGEVNLGKYGGVGGRAEAWAGVGAQFQAKVGYKDGKFQARVDIGAALGIGFKLGFNVNIDVKGLVNKAKELVAKPIEAIKNVGHTIGNAIKKLKFW